MIFERCDLFDVVVSLDFYFSYGSWMLVLHMMPLILILDLVVQQGPMIDGGDDYRAEYHSLGTKYLTLPVHRAMLPNEQYDDDVVIHSQWQMPGEQDQLHLLLVIASAHPIRIGSVVEQMIHS